MPAYFVAEIEITNQAGFEPYRAAPPVRGSSASVSPIGSATVVRQRFFWIFWCNSHSLGRAAVPY
jgi:hypothetical protein